MPIYEYRCRKCGHKFEKRRGFSDSDRDIHCPECGEPHPERIFSVFGTASSGSSGGSCNAPSSSPFT